jgi:Entner-Doudoroff aldolase
MDTAELFERQFAPVMAILRGFAVDRTLELCMEAWDAGIGLVEIPVQSAEAVDALRAAAIVARSRDAIVGAGTVTSLERLELARDAGASFTVSPGLDIRIAKASQRLGLPHLPGVATATEVDSALKLGLTWLKAFPAEQLGIGWAHAMHGPFPEARFVATGGVDLTNAESFLEAGYSIVSLGSALADPIQAERLPALVTRTARSAAE